MCVSVLDVCFRVGRRLASRSLSRSWFRAGIFHVEGRRFGDLGYGVVLEFGLFDIEDDVYKALLWGNRVMTFQTDADE